MGSRRGAGALALLGGGEWGAGCRALDEGLLEFAAGSVPERKAGSVPERKAGSVPERRVGGSEVIVLPTAAAFEHPERVAARATAYFDGLGASVRTLAVLHRKEAEDPEIVATVRAAKFVYLVDGSPLHLRSVLKGSALFEALVSCYHGGGVIAASGAGATLLGDPMVDPRGGAYTVGLGLIRNLAVFPYHGTAADHLRERSIDLLPSGATLVGIDEETALVLRDGTWTVAGAGTVTVYAAGVVSKCASGATVEGLPG